MWDATELVRMALSAIYRTGQRFGATPAARPVLRGEVPAMLRQQLAVTATTKAAKAKRGSSSGWTSGVSGVSGASAVGGKLAAELTPADEVLFESLKAWRLEAAREANVPAFVILHDSVLREIAAARPKNKTALAAISGIGESKLARFGDGILERVGS